MFKKLITTGTKFGNRVVIKQSRDRLYGYVRYKVLCECGEISDVSGAYLRQYPYRKCRRCSLKEKTKKKQEHYAYKHGFAGNGEKRKRIYSIWVEMRSRCNCPTNLNYMNYGARGIKVCKEWDNFENFYRDMGDPSIKGIEIDRINNELGYSKENCRWVNKSQNARNRRSSVFYELPNGDKINKQELIESLKWTKSVFRRRFENASGNWGIEKIIQEYNKLK